MLKLAIYVYFNKYSKTDFNFVSIGNLILILSVDFKKWKIILSEYCCKMAR